MSNPLTDLEDAMTALRAAWAGSNDPQPGSGRASADTTATATPSDASTLGRERLVAVLRAVGAVGRRLDAVRADVAAEVDRQSRPELGARSLAKEHGHRNGAAFIAEATGISRGEAARLAAVGRSVTPRPDPSGEQRPARHPHVAEAMAAGGLTAAAAELIITMLDRAASTTTAEDRDRAEKTLAAQAAGLGLDHVRTLVTRARAWLDPDGIQPAERDRRAERALRLWERNGMLHIDGTIDTVVAAPVKTAIEGIVTAMMRHTRDDVTAGDEHPARPTVVQLQADALVQLASHALSCRNDDLPLEDTTVIVRVALDTLQTGQGLAEIDGIAQPLSAAAARRLASTAGVIPCVLGGDSEILDWGHRRRLFTPAQKLALAERDGGCAMCHLPPGMTKAHHIRWWARDHGPTDIRNGVLLCQSCHHRVHNNGWDVCTDPPGPGTPGGRAGFIPPAAVDPQRRPRLGGKARYDYVPAA